jgi:hypothetical protein
MRDRPRPFLFVAGPSQGGGGFVLFAVVAAVLAAVAVVLGAALALVAAPIGLAAYFYGRWRFRRMVANLRPRPQGPAAHRIIEADYRVIDEG